MGIEDFYLYGHSWGTMLGTEYYYKYPDHVKALILASPALSISRWLADGRELINTLPDSVKMAIEVNEASGNFNSPGYLEAVNTFYQKYLARKLPWDANMDSTFSGANLAIYNYMWGPSEFTATGTLKGFERTDKLSQIKVPTLFVCGEYDEARPSTVQYFQSLVPNSKFALIGDAAHITMHDNPQGNNEAISNFLRKIDRN